MSSTRVARHALSAVAILGLAACGTSSSPTAPTAPTAPIPTTISTAAGQWDFRFSSAMPAHPAAVSNGWYFDFPSYAESPTTGCRAVNCPAVNYLTTATRIALQGRALSASVQIDVTGAPVFQFALEPENVCGGPATMRLFLERANEPTASTAEFYRWWSDMALPLAPGGGNLTVPVTPDRWGSVFGTKGNASPAALAGFEATLADLATVGMTFGGGCFAGHGVNISGGTARFILTSFLAQ